MNGNTGRIRVVAASFLGRLSLLLVILGGGMSADARVVTAPHDVVALSPATFAAAPGASHGDARLMHAVADARTLPAVLAAAAHEPIGERTDEIALLSAAALDASPFAEARLTATPAPFDARPAAARATYGLPLPEPDGWTAVAATIALALFFFLRRLA